MKNSELVFIGIKGSVVALNSATGQQAWATPLKGADIVNVVLQHEALLATCAGEIFCLDPFTGKILWHNPLKGFGLGICHPSRRNSIRATPRQPLRLENTAPSGGGGGGSFGIVVKRNACAASTEQKLIID